MTVRKMFVTTTIAAAVLLACAALLLGAWAEEARGAFPGKNGKIAFVSSQDGDFDIYKMNPDGSGLKKLTNNTVSDFDPSWSPDGSKVAYSRRRGNDMNEIFVKNTTNGQNVQLTDSNDSMSDLSPSWSPDGSRIVFVSRDLVDGSKDIWVMNSDGSGRQRLTTNSLSEGTVAWSPDGSKIAFDTESNENDIWVMNSDGTNLQNLTNTSEPSPVDFEGGPTWSPDGSRIAFAAAYYVAEAAGLTHDIYAINADGSGRMNLTDTPTLTEVSPAWSPNGRKIAFRKVRTDNFASNIWVMNADGTSPQNVTDSSEGEWGRPDWQPIPQATP